MPRCPVCGHNHALGAPCLRRSAEAPDRARGFIPAMSQDLRTFLDRVWQNRHAIQDAGDIYDLYSQVAAPNLLHGGFTMANGLNYLRELCQIGRNRNPPAQPSVQDYESFSFPTLLGTAILAVRSNIEPLPGQLVDFLNATMNARGVVGVTPGMFLASELMDTFYHYVVQGAVIPVTERIYLNVSANNATVVMGWVVQNVVDAVPGVVEAKVAGPRAVQSRTDTIIIYTRDSVVTQAVLLLLAGYQTGAGAGLFNLGTPALTLPAPGLTGVGVGAEPVPITLGARITPNHRALAYARQSFGGIRSDLVWLALEEAGNSLLVFYERVVVNFRNAGLDPMRPHLQLGRLRLTMELSHEVVDEVFRRHHF